MGVEREEDRGREKRGVNEKGEKYIIILNVIPTNNCPVHLTTKKHNAYQRINYMIRFILKKKMSEEK